MIQTQTHRYQPQTLSLSILMKITEMFRDYNAMLFMLVLLEAMIGAHHVYVRNIEDAIAVKAFIQNVSSANLIFKVSDWDMVRNIPGLTYLYSDSVDYVGIAPVVSSLKDVQCLGLERAGITRRSLPQICGGLGSLPQLTALDLSENSIGLFTRDDIQSGEASSLSSFHLLSHLEYLRLNNCDLNTEDITGLLRERGEWPLKHLDVANNSIFINETQIAYFSGLQCLDISFNAADEDINVFVESLTETQNHSLVSLTLPGSLSKSSCERLLKSCEKISELSVGINSNETLNVLAKSVSHLQLLTCKLEMSEMLAKTNPTSALAHLALLGYDLSCSDVEILEKSKLTTIYVRRIKSPLPDNIALLCGCTNLEQLFLYDNRMSGELLRSVFRSVNSSPALIALGVSMFTIKAQEADLILQEMTRPLHNLWINCNLIQKGYEQYVAVCGRLERRLCRPGMVSLIGPDKRPPFFSMSGVHHAHLPAHVRAFFCRL